MPVIYHKNVMYGGGSGGGGVAAISDLTDVELSNLSDGQILKYDSTSQKWVNDDESGSNQEEYSTNEIVIGKWIDNKPIYRLVITPWINGTLQTGYTYANNILSVSPFNNRNVKEIVNCRLLSPRNGSNGGYTDVMVANYSSATGNNDAIVPNTDGTIWIKSLSNGQNRSVTVILEYTKTTD